MLRRWFAALVFLVMAVGILPVSAQSSCTISTRATVRMRAGHSTTDAVVGTMPRNVQLQAVERFVESLGGKKTRLWFRLVKEEAAPTATSEQVWVGGSVKTKGDCVNIASAAVAPAAPAGDAGAAPAAVSGVVLPQSGTWRWTLGDTVNISCDGIGSADFSTGEALGASGFDIEIASSADSFAVDGVGYTRDGNGTWNGYYAEPEIQATGTAYIRVDTSTSVLGDMVIVFADEPGCSFKVPFWGAPK